MDDADAALHDPLLAACRALWAAMDAFEEAAARHLGIGRSDLRALNLLERGPATPAELADRLGLRRASVTALVDRLVAADLVSREPVPGDRRSRLVELTPQTWQRFAAVYRPVADQVHGASRAMTEHQRASAVGALTAVGGVFARRGRELADG